MLTVTVYNVYSIMRPSRLCSCIRDAGLCRTTVGFLSDDKPHVAPHD